MADQELDVREIRKPQKHPTIFARYGELAVGESFVLVNNHDPKHLHDEFEVDFAGGYGWEYLERGPVWRIRISKLHAAPLPRVLVNTVDVANAEPDVTGAVWKLQIRERDLDSNLIALPPDGGIGAHNGADVDVLIHVLSGDGRLIVEQGQIELRPGSVLWLPKFSRREFKAGPQGLRYLTVHRHRDITGLMPTVRAT